MLTIVENNTPRWASNTAVQAHVESQLPGSHPIRTILRWSEAYRRSLGIYTPKEVRPKKQKYQDYDSGTLSYTGTDVLVTFQVFDIPLDKAKEMALQDLAAQRYIVETGGFDFNGVALATDRDSQGKYTAVRIAAKENPNYTVNWKTENGFQALDAATIIAITDAVRVFVQNAYDHEAALANDITNAETIDSLRAIDISAGW